MSLSTWSPFQSNEVREMCAHMTPAEQNRASGRAALYGVWVMVSFVLPIRAAWQRRTRAFLRSTQWARSRGFAADIKLFKFRRAA